MCGIFGHFTATGADAGMVERMAHTLAHRGPDGYGTHNEQTLSFGAGRLAIIDLAAPAGPLYSEDRQTIVVFNGEIYNYRALRAILEQTGHHFATATDTEVIVHGYEQWGVGVLEHLDGMFAFALWDAARAELLLARDRLGEKPLYYADMGAGEFLFASEVKALFEHPHLRRAVNTAVLPTYLVLGFVAPPQTLFAGVQKLAPGEYIRVGREGITSGRYWHPAYHTENAPPYPQSVAQVRATLQGAVERQMMSDVPVGAFLSGGVDSSAIVALMRQYSPYPVRTFTVGFEAEPGSPTDLKFNVDVRYAAQAAQHFGTDHQVITIPNDERIAWLLPHLIYAMDEPISMPTIIQTAFVTALARTQGVPVLLSGEGGDEVFFGYTHYRAEQTLSRYLRVPALLRDHLLNPIFRRTDSAALGKLARKASQTTPQARYLEWLRRMEHPRVAELLRSVTSAQDSERVVDGILSPYLHAPGAGSFIEQIAFADLRLVLAENMNLRVDKMSMAMSIEARAPFQDRSVVELALGLPTSYKLGGDFKRVLKDAVRDVVPETILRRPKWGFTPPASEWMRTILRPLIETTLTRERVESVGIFRWETVEAIKNAHIVERKYELWSLWTTFIFHLWYSLYIDQSLTLSDTFDAAHLVEKTGLRG